MGDAVAAAANGVANAVTAAAAANAAGNAAAAANAVGNAAAAAAAANAPPEFRYRPIYHFDGVSGGFCYPDYPSSSNDGTCRITLEASYPGLLTPAFVTCSTNAGEGLVKLSHVV